MSRPGSPLRRTIIAELVVTTALLAGVIAAGQLGLIDRMATNVAFFLEPDGALDEDVAPWGLGGPFVLPYLTLIVGFGAILATAQLAVAYSMHRVLWLWLLFPTLWIMYTMFGISAALVRLAMAP